MLEAPTRSRRAPRRLTIAFLAGLALSSCATEQPHTALVDDPDAQRESSIPWNKPARWESGANLPGNLGGSGVGGGLTGPGPGY